jgi:hypothetical protein
LRIVSEETGMAGTWAPWAALGLLVVREVAGVVIQHLSRRVLERLTRHTRARHRTAGRPHDGSCGYLAVDDPTSSMRSEVPVDRVRPPR